ncbi:Receptor-type tyrosine-protein phosphatase gamma [Varanus komodoensis]|nr:Receptor-type tyrosine-protein phosphatase gamma [Varanus komodoensis]
MGPASVLRPDLELISKDEIWDVSSFQSPFHCIQGTQGAYGPEHWVASNVDCGKTHQSPIDIIDHQARVGEEYQEIRLVGFDNESSNKTWMKNTGKTVIPVI